MMGGGPLTDDDDIGGPPILAPDTDESVGWPRSERLAPVGIGDLVVDGAGVQVAGSALTGR